MYFELLFFIATNFKCSAKIVGLKIANNSKIHIINDLR